MARLHPALLVLLVLPMPAVAQPITAEQAIENQRRQLQAVTGTRGAGAADCERSGNSDEIVVCGREDNDRHRLPLPMERTPGEPTRLVAGESPSGAAAMAAGGCQRLCHQPVQIDLIGAARGAARAIGRLLDPDD